MSSMRHQPFLLFAMSVSLFGLFITIVLASNPPVIVESFFWRKPLIGSIFGLICVLGVFAALMPKLCSNALHFRVSEKEPAVPETASFFSKAHHPSCGEFSAHVIHVRGCTICAACTGLLGGAVIALFGTTSYFLCEWQIKDASLLSVLIGVVCIALGFFQLEFRSFIRTLLNVLFVFGAFLVLVGIDALITSLFVDLFITALIAFWIFTRIELSRWDHWRICSNCGQPCEVGKARKSEKV